MAQFRRSKAVRYFKKDQLPREKDLMLLYEGPARDIQAWEDHYVSIGTPYVLTRDEKLDGNGVRRTIFKIWKRRIV